MPKIRIEQASDALANPPHPGDPTSHVTRDGGEPLHKPPMPGYDPETGKVDEEKAQQERDEQSADERVKHAAVPSNTGRDHFRDGNAGRSDSPYLEDGVSGGEGGAQQWRDDPMPEGAQERLDWAQRGTDTTARINAAVRAEEARGGRRRPTVLSGLEALRREHKKNESDNS